LIDHGRRVYDPAARATRREAGLMLRSRSHAMLVRE